MKANGENASLAHFISVALDILCATCMHSVLGPKCRREGMTTSTDCHHLVIELAAGTKGARMFPWSNAGQRCSRWA